LRNTRPAFFIPVFPGIMNKTFFKNLRWAGVYRLRFLLQDAERKPISPHSALERWWLYFYKRHRKKFPGRVLWPCLLGFLLQTFASLCSWLRILSFSFALAFLLSMKAHGGDMEICISKICTCGFVFFVKCRISN